MRKHIPYPIIILVSFFVLILVMLFSLTVGEVPMRFSEIIGFLSHPNTIEHDILLHIRIPRTLLAFAVGGGLSLSGVILQGLYRNPLVEPYTLGISGGALLGVTFAIVTGLSLFSRFTMPVFGFAGALATIFLVYTLSLRRGMIQINRMLLIGVMISFISASLVMFLMSISSSEKISSIVFWTMGALNESNKGVVIGMVVLSILALMISLCFSTPLNALRIGESQARHLGIHTGQTIRILFVLTSLLTGSCIAVAGMIGFVGLTIPHITRLLVGTDYKILLASSFLNGSIFLILCDILARWIVSPNELPIGVITGILGGITFIIIVCGPKMRSTF